METLQVASDFSYIIFKILTYLEKTRHEFPEDNASLTPLFQERCRLTRIEIKEGEQVEASEKKTELLEGIQGFDHFEDRKQG